jgi:PAS domain S-box-containing protein
MKDDFEAYDVYDEINKVSNNIKIQSMHVYNNKYGANDHASLIIIEESKRNAGKITCINNGGIGNEVTEMFGYEKADLLGINVLRLMPPIIGSYHSEMMLRYFSAGKLNTKKEKFILALHKKGYIIPCNYYAELVLTSDLDYK